MKKISFTILALIALLPLVAQTTSPFDDLGLPTDSFWNGSTGTGGFSDGHAYFKNSYNATYQSWSGFAYSNKKDTTTAGYNNQYSCAAGGGVNGSNTFAVAYAGGGDAIARLQGAALGHQAFGVYVTNSTYGYLSMKNGDQFAKKFGGATGHDPDWFRVTIGGWYQGAPLANSLQVYLADFRSVDSTQHYIQKTWKFVDLSTLGNIDSLSFILSSSDTGSFGMNTPAYFCLDNFITSDGVARVTPRAINDSVATNYHDSVVVNVLGNDTVGNFGPFTVSITSGPLVAGASAYINAANNLVYIPALGIRTQDTVRYRLCDQAAICSDAFVLVNVFSDTNTSITDIDAASFRLYPNPANAQISVSSESIISHVTIIDMSGREVLAIDMDKHAAFINIAALSTGLYTAVIHTQSGVGTRRFVKE